ncbi:MAG TPA: ParB N-terminal domain-containing protein, partial [Pyrinomonadaceae bacterium]|nr:ParB N-terminal domain-containing protein [Pyrinomonadaceae bacterium]
MPKRKQENNVKEIGENLPELNEPPSAYADSLPQMDVLKIIPSPFEPQTRRRAHFKQNELEELAASIFQNGLIQPVILRPAKEPEMFE